MKVVKVEQKVNEKKTKMFLKSDVLINESKSEGEKKLSTLEKNAQNIENR